MSSLLQDLAQSIADRTGKVIRIEPAGIKATPSIPSWDTLEEDVKWACEKVYKDSHK